MHSRAPRGYASVTEGLGSAMGGKRTLGAFLNHSACLARGSHNAIKCVGLLKQYTPINALASKSETISSGRVNDRKIRLSFSGATCNFPTVEPPIQPHIQHHQEAVGRIAKQTQSFFAAGRR